MTSDSSRFLRSFVLALWILGDLAAVATAMPPRPVFEHIDSRDGLAHNSVGAILQDRRGFLWIGTFAGLNRFDGVEFVVWRHEAEDPKSLSSNSVTGLLEDRAGQLWVGTDRGLDRFEQRGWAGERFHHYQARGPDGSAITSPVRALFEDRAGVVWAGLIHGLLRYLPEEDRVELFRHDPRNPQSLAPGSVHAIQQDGTGALWILTGPAPENRDVGSTLNRLAPGSAVFERFPAPDDLNGTGLLIDRSDRFWLNVPGLGTFDPSSGRYDHPLLKRNEATFGGLWEDRAGALWISTLQGFLRYQPVAGEVDGPWPAVAKEDRLAGFAAIFEEGQGETLWLGTRAGLFKWDRRRKPFDHVFRRPGDAGSLTSDRVSAVLEDRAGTLWLGTYGAGLNRFEDLDSSATHYRHDPRDPSSLCHDTVWHLAEDAGGLWLGVGDGLCRYEPGSGRFRRVLDASSIPSGEGSVRFIIPTQSGDLWLATEAGLLSFDPASATVQRHGSPEPDGPGNGLIHTLFLADGGSSLWLSSQGGSLDELDLGTGSLVRHPLTTRAGHRLRSEAIFAFWPEESGALWLGSGEGLSRYDPSTGELEHFAAQDGLPGTSVYSILADDAGRLWLGTDQGLSRFDATRPPGQRFRNYSLSDGIGNLEFNRHAAERTRDGRFLFAGMNGLTSFVPSEIHDNPVIPAVALTRISVWTPAGESVFHPGALQDLILTPLQSSIAFEFAALDFTRGARNRYAYRLEGFDDGWIDNGDRRLARYHRLPPGRYTFRVKGSNNDGLWNERGASITIRILPFFWQTWWFRLTLIALALAALVAIHRLRVSRLLQIERLRTRIAGDLHDDLSSELSGIALAMEVLQDGRLGGEKPRLAQIRQRSLLMLDRLRDIVWCVNPEHDNQEALISRLRSVAETLLVGRRYRFETQLTGGEVSLAQRRNLLLIYKEALHNIVRHSDASQVEIRMADGGSCLRLAIVDDGIGYEESAVGSGYGLMSMRRRAAEMGAMLCLVSHPGKGTEVRLEVPMSRWRGKR